MFGSAIGYLLLARTNSHSSATTTKHTHPPQRRHREMAQQTPLPGYEEEMKQELKHVEYGAKVSHVDLHEAAASGHLATDLYGHVLVTIDKAASDRLARKVRST